MSESTVPVFISWSGEPSRVVAQALATFINDCIQAAAPWTSDDIPKGAAWPDAILTRLQESALGIVCVTKANQSSPWLLFEGGALAKHKTLHVFLIDAVPTDIKPPLGLYQTTLAEKAEVLKLLAAIDAKVPEAHQRGAERLRRDCNKNWPELEDAIEQARGQLQNAAKPPIRDDRELLEEILTTVRGLADKQALQDKIQEAAKAFARRQAILDQIPPPDAKAIWESIQEEQRMVREQSGVKENPAHPGARRGRSVASYVRKKKS